MGVDENMKANRKFVEANEAISAVIGVILMVAITVAIAATVYVYVSGMIGTSPETTPSLQLTRDNTDKTCTVASADPGNLKWNTFNITWTTTVTHLDLVAGGTRNVVYDDNVVINGLEGLADTVIVTAGDVFNLTGTGKLTIRHVPTNTLVGTYQFS